MAWVYLLIAGLLEVVWAYSMKQSQGFTNMPYTALTLVTMVISFFLLSASMKALPLGTAYMVWTGIGAVGAFAAGILLLGEPVSFSRVLAAFLIVAGLVIMRFSGSH